MAGPLPVKGTEISSAPCSVRKAASLLRCFLWSEAASEVGIARGYIETVAQSLEEILARGKNSGTEGLKLTSIARSSKFFNVEPVPTNPEIKKRPQEDGMEGLIQAGVARSSKLFNIEPVLKMPEIEKIPQEDKESKRKKKVQATFDFEALLGHELDGAEIGKQADGELGFEERIEMLPSTPRQADSVDDGRELQKSDKKEKKMKSLGGAAMGVDFNGVQSSSKAEENDPDYTKSAKKEKKRKKSLVTEISNGLFDSPSKEFKVEARDEDKNMKPADDVRKKKKKKHRGDTSQGATPMKEESKKVLTEHVVGSIGDKESNGNDSGMQQQSRSVTKKSKKRSSEPSSGNSDDQPRKSKKLRWSN